MGQRAAIAAKVEWTEKISQIKSMIAEKKDIPKHVQHLYLGHESWFEKNKLMNFESLQDNRISKKASINGYLTDRVEFPLDEVCTRVGSDPIVVVFA